MELSRILLVLFPQSDHRVRLVHFVQWDRIAVFDDDPCVLSAKFARFAVPAGVRNHTDFVHHVVYMVCHPSGFIGRNQAFLKARDDCLEAGWLTRYLADALSLWRRVRFRTVPWPHVRNGH